MKKKQKFFNLETFDYTPYARELTEEEMYLVNGGRVVKGSARETEVVPSRPSSSSESGNSSGTPATSNSSPAPAATQTSTSSSPQNNTESQPQTSSAPTCTAAQMAAAQGAAMNAYFAEQDKKREENNKQQSNSGSSSSSSSSSSALSHQEQYEMAQKDYDEHYGNVASETSSSSSDSSTAYTTNDQYLMAQKDYDAHYGRSDNSLGEVNGVNNDSSSQIENISDDQETWIATEVLTMTGGEMRFCYSGMTMLNGTANVIFSNGKESYAKEFEVTSIYSEGLFFSLGKTVTTTEYTKKFPLGVSKDEIIKSYEGIFATQGVSVSSDLLNLFSISGNIGSTFTVNPKTKDYDADGWKGSTTGAGISLNTDFGIPLNFFKKNLSLNIGTQITVYRDPELPNNEYTDHPEWFFYKPFIPE